MVADTKDLTQLFSVGSNDSSPEIGEIRRKKTSNSEMTTYDVVAHINTNNKKIKIIDKTLSASEIDFIRSHFSK